uniref:Uncharacterized protein n=1 Tax=Oryza brachyantha TaxID=4533 RepID=J3MKR2_ORYBR
MGSAASASETDLKGWLAGREWAGLVAVDRDITSSWPPPPPPLPSPVWRRRGKTRSSSSSNHSCAPDLDADVDVAGAQRHPSPLLWTSSPLRCPSPRWTPSTGGELEWAWDSAHWQQARAGQAALSNPAKTTSARRRDLSGAHRHGGRERRQRSTVGEAEMRGGEDEGRGSVTESERRHLLIAGDDEDKKQEGIF